MTSKQSIPKLPTGVKLSDVFHLAADEHLAENESSHTIDKYKYSCVAIDETLVEIFDGNWKMAEVFQRKCINPGLKALGLDVGSTQAFKSLGCASGEVNSKAQAARYSWLKFCAMLAEEQEAVGASWN